MVKTVNEKSGKSSVKLEVDQIVTLMHILFLVMFQIVSVMIPVSFAKKETLLSVRSFTTSYFLFGAQDIFVSFMMWFVIQEGNTPTFFVDQKTN